MITRRTIVVGLSFLPLACSCSAGERSPSTAGETISPEDLGWTTETDPVATAAIINRALEIARARGVTYYDNAPRRIAGTIRLGSKVIIEFGGLHRWQAVYDDLNRFDPVNQYGRARYGPSGKRVFVDISGAHGSIIRGPMHLTAAWPKNMSLAERAKIPADLVAMTASQPEPSGEISIETFTVSGFGHALYQGRQTGWRQLGGERAILPYTRLRVGTAHFRFCLQPITTGASGNGLDDAIFDVLRFSRNGGASILRGTELNAQSFFNYGLRESLDTEPGNISLEAGSPIARMENDISGIERGMILAILGGGTNIGGNNIMFISEVVDVNGSELRFSDAPDQSFTGKFMANPPSIILFNSGINAIHLYVEGVHDFALALNARSKLSAPDFKVSGGEFGSRGGYAVAVMGEQTSIDIQLNPRSVNNKVVKGIVGLYTDSANPQGRIISAEPQSGQTRHSVLVGDGRPAGRARARVPEVSGGGVITY